MIIAENPKIIIRSLKKGIVNTMSLPEVTVFFASILLKNKKSKNEILQIKVNLEKNEMIFIK
jgi:hypothetical protein